MSGNGNILYQSFDFLSIEKYISRSISISSSVWIPSTHFSPSCLIWMSKVLGLNNKIRGLSKQRSKGDRSMVAWMRDISTEEPHTASEHNHRRPHLVAANRIGEAVPGMRDRPQGGSEKGFCFRDGIGIWPARLIMSIRLDYRSMRCRGEWITILGLACRLALGLRGP